MAVCANCNSPQVFWCCKNCPNNAQFFCDQCSSFHSKVKCYRGHFLTKVEEVRVPNCSNCDVNRACFECCDCSLENSFLCKDCALFHTKTKLYKQHTLKEVCKQIVNKDNNFKVQNDDSLFHYILTGLAERFIPVYAYFVSNEEMDWRKVAIGLFTALLIQIISRNLLGRGYLVIISIIGILVWRVLQKSKIPEHYLSRFETIESKTSRSTLTSHELDDNLGKGSFTWDQGQCAEGLFRFRQRRPYKRRGRKAIL